MKRLKIAIMMGLCFTVGTLFGLLLHLPGGIQIADGSLSRNERASGAEGRRFNAFDLDSTVQRDGTVVNSLEGIRTDSRINIQQNTRVLNKKNNSAQGAKRLGKHLSQKTRFANTQASESSETVAKHNVRTRPSTTGQKPVKKFRTSVNVIVGGGKPKQDGGASQKSAQGPFTRLSQIATGPYWSTAVEAFLPAGFSDNAVKNWNNFSRKTKLVRMQEGCGRMQNRLLTFMDASQSCARYRINTDQIQGEIFSFYLSRVLGIRNIPPSVLKTVTLRDQQWEKIGGDIQNAQWSEEKPFIMTQWVKNLVPAYIPVEFREESRSLSPNQTTLLNKSVPQLLELLQWSDLIVFDYITANLDRVVNNMFNRQWNSQIMAGPAHNLEKSADTGLLVFLDNESGLFHSYRLLDKYAHFHESLLKSLCIFRHSTARKIKRWHQHGDVLDEMWTAFSQHEPLHHSLPWVPEKNLKILKSRISDVYNQIRHCENVYGNGGES